MTGPTPEYATVALRTLNSPRAGVSDMFSAPNETSLKRAVAFLIVESPDPLPFADALAFVESQITSGAWRIDALTAQAPIGRIRRA